MKNPNHTCKRYKTILPEAGVVIDETHGLMQDYNFSICIQENKAQVLTRGFQIWIN